MSNLWVLTEERPKISAVKGIIDKFLTDNDYSAFFNPIRFIPILNDDGNFDFTYTVLGISCSKIENIYIKTISGSSSFVDYLLFFQDKEPKEGDVPVYAIEETKTTDKESRNTGVFQRATKFVFIKHFYEKAKMIMFYNLHTEEQQNPTPTNIFGTKCFLTLGVEIMGKAPDKDIKPFKSIDEVIEFKNGMKRPPKGNVPILITKLNNHEIEVSGRLFKPGSGLSHDPNIGALSLICATLRELGWKGKLTITEHQLEQRNITPRNKFIILCNELVIGIKGLNVPKCVYPKTYWHYERAGEKLGTIFIHLVVENFTTGQSIFENHAGCEKSYFKTNDNQYIQIEKYRDREKYKQGDKKQIIQIPDLILVDFDRKQVINTEGKTYSNLDQGIEEIELFDAIEEKYIEVYYKDYFIIRTIVLYGSTNNTIKEVKVGFLLNENGEMVLGPKAPELFIDAINRLKSYW